MRIRSVKPEYWRSADTAALDYFVRLFFIGLWNYVDDNGVGEDNLNLIRSDLFPRDDIETVSLKIQGALTELSNKGHIIRYRHVVSGRRYLKVAAWHHQKINRPTESFKPLPTSEDVELTEDSLNAHGAITDDSLRDQGIKGRDQGKGGDAEQRVHEPSSSHTEPERSAPPPEFCPKHPGGTDLPCRGCQRHRETRQRWDEQRILREKAERQAELQRQRECQECAGTGWRDIGDAVTPCECRTPRPRLVHDATNQRRSAS